MSTKRLLITFASAACLVITLPGGTLAQADTESVAPDLTDDQPWIAYQTGGSGADLIHPDGSGLQRVAPDFRGDLVLPDWSPDGRRLVMTSRSTGGDEPLFEYDLATETLTRLFPSCEEPLCYADEPAYSPDGTTVAFIRALGPLVDGIPSDCGLWMGDLTSGEVRQVTSNPGCDREYSPRWSPDGSQLTYWRWREDESGTTGTAVFVIDADGTDERQLTAWDSFTGDADWSPDGEWIVYATYPGAPFSGDVVSNLYRMHPDGTGTEQLTFNFEPTERATQPHYTPDGESIIFTASGPTRPPERELVVIPAAGGDEILSVAQGRLASHGTWQPTPSSS